MTRLRFRLCVLGALGVAGCAKAEPLETGPVVYRSDGLPDGASLSLVDSGSRSDQVALDLVAHDIDELYGVAFRMTYDPNAIGFTQIAPGPAFAQAPERVVIGREPITGLLVGAVTRVGRKLGVSGRGGVVAHLTFERARKAPTRIDFVDARSTVLGADGRTLAASFVGGMLEP